MKAARRIVVVGGVAAGASAATKARRTDEDAEIIIFERGPYVSFANCGLPYYVGGDIQQVDDLLLMTPADFRIRYRIRVEVQHEVVAIDRDARQVEVKDLSTGQHRWEPFDRLVLAPGGRPVLPPIPGIDQEGVFSLTTVPEAERLRSWALAGQVRHAAVVGGGFIGIESVEALVHLGLEVHLVEKLPQLLPQMDWEMAAPLGRHLESKGVHLHLGGEVTRFLGDGELQGLELSTGEVVPAQVAVVAIGVRPELALAQQAGLGIGPSGGVVVDDRMRTSDPDIFACGDVAEVVNRITGQRVRLPLAGPANKEGRVAGSNAAGGNLRFPGVIGTSIVKVCDLSAGKTGLSEREARLAGLDPIVTYTHPSSHAEYFPGAQPMAMKLLADRESGRVLGGQIVGSEGVDKRIDVLATAIQAEMTVEDLEGLDLAYAPPYSSAKDPVVMAGFVSANQWRGEVEMVTVLELAREMDAGQRVRLVDVRRPEDFAEGHLPGAENLPLGRIRRSLSRFDPEETITVSCLVGATSYNAYKILKHHGFKVRNLAGGFTSWSQTYPDRVATGEQPGLEVSAASN